MPKVYFILFFTFLLVESIHASTLVDCRVVTGRTTACNQYTSKLIYAKEARYEKNRKKLIISKTLPVPKKIKIKVISVSDMIEKYINVEDSLGFQGLEKKSFTPNNVVPKKVIDEKIKHVHQHMETTLPKDKEQVTQHKNIHPLPLPKDYGNYGFYKVVKGDVLSIIATRFGFTLKALAILNNLDNNSIHVGQKLKIPLSQEIIDAIITGEYMIQPGDTLLAIAHRFNVSSKDLVRINYIKSNTVIHKGKKLILPFSRILKKLIIGQKKLVVKREAESKKKKLERKKRARKEVKMIRTSGKRKLRVTATAYTSHRRQTDSTPFIAAWNNHIKPGMKILAVSRDLITRYGLRNGTKVRIGGLVGQYVVRDKMNKRYRKRIDIYMGLNKRRALRWGRRSVIIQY